MAEIVLTTLNARYTHCAFGLRYLLANLPPNLQARAVIREFEISQRPTDVLEALLRENPRIVGLGVYIWNAQASRVLVAELKRVAPQVIVVVGGPEVSHEIDKQEICRLADYVLPGEADLSFAKLCDELLSKQADAPDIAMPRGDLQVMQKPRIINNPLPTMDELVLPYDLYDERDLSQRTVYVEASRGCPFSCEFCLSSLEVPVREVPLDRFLQAMGNLLERGLLRFKFVDRTFNLNIRTSRAILQFFLERYQPGLFLHFEMIPDRLPGELREVIARFPAGALQFEVGIQTFNEEVAGRISRRQNSIRTTENLRWLREHTGVYLHADLIVGLPGETLESFAAGFDQLVALGPHEIQIELLKRLRGTPIARHDEPWGMVYSPEPPYEILCNSVIDFPTMQRLRRFARSWDLLANSGNFVRTLPRFWQGSSEGMEQASPGSPFEAVMHWSDWVYARLGRVHQISLTELLEQIFGYLTLTAAQPADAVAMDLWEDYQRGGRNDVPPCLRPYVGMKSLPRTGVAKSTHLPRQARRLGKP